MGATSPAIFVVLGSDNGGVGKSTIAANLSIGVAKSGLSVGLLDLDGRQRTVARWHQRRIDVSERGHVPVTIPALAVVEPAAFDSISLNEECDFDAFQWAVARLDATCDVIIADTPPGDSYLARLSHQIADIVLTPIEHGVVDREMLFGDGAGPPQGQVARSYAAMIKQAREKRNKTDDGQFDWLVVPNRRGTKGEFAAPSFAGTDVHLDSMGTDMGFRTCSGLSEQLIYRSAFTIGRSVFDHESGGSPVIGYAGINARVRAREEVNALISALYLPFAKAPAEIQVAT